MDLTLHFFKQVRPTHKLSPFLGFGCWVWTANVVAPSQRGRLSPLAVAVRADHVVQGR